MPFYIDPLSFGIGAVFGILVAFFAVRMRPAFREWRAGMTARREETQARRSTGVEDNHRRITLRRAQGMHLAAPLFALDEILLPPRFMAPPPRVEPGALPPAEDIVSQTLPYLPSWPELATLYRAPSLTLPQALSGGSHIVVIGADGLGKTVTLAHLATLSANRDPSLGELAERVPFLIHVADLSLPVDHPQNILNPIMDAEAEQISFLEIGRMSSFVQYTFKSGRALLLLDGFDELSAEGQKTVSDFLKTLLQAHPGTRLVATALPEQMDGLLGLGFAPLALMGWDTHRQTEFIRKWGAHWKRFITTEAWAQMTQDAIDPILLEAWLGYGNQYLTPLELTLKIWGGFAGDSLGPHVQDVIATHIRRVAPPDTPAAALETLAMQVVLNAQPVFDPRKAREWVRSFEPAEEKPAEGTSPAEGELPRTGPLGQKKEAGAVQVPSSGLLGKMSASGLLLAHPNNRMRFLHPIFSGYLAGRALNVYKTDEALARQADWGGKLLAMRYLSSQGDAARAVEAMLKVEDALLQRPLLNAARWLREAPREAAWRGRVMAGLARLLQDETRPRGLRGQAMAALVLCGDPGAAAFFRQSLQSLSFDLIALAALGSGAVQDSKALELLSSTTSAPSLAARRAACLALVAIGTTNALEAVAHILLEGDDDLRRAAAEALANDPGEGHAMLKDGVTMPDLLIRRSIVYGLARVDEAWALEALQDRQVNDEQWLVKNAATEVIESSSSAHNPRIPRPLTPPSETQWLIEFAGKQGVGIAPGVPATEILLKALDEGLIEERLAALEYLRRAPTESVVKRILESLHSMDTDLREAAYQTLWELASGGVALPVHA